MDITITWTDERIGVRLPYRKDTGEPRTDTFTPDQLARLDVAAGALIGKCVRDPDYDDGLTYRAAPTVIEATPVELPSEQVEPEMTESLPVVAFGKPSDAVHGREGEIR